MAADGQTHLTKLIVAPEKQLWILTFVLFHPEYFRLSASTFPWEWFFRLWISRHLHGRSSCWLNWNVRTNLLAKFFLQTTLTLRRLHMFTVHAVLVSVRYAMPGASAASSLTHANAVLTHLQRARFCLRYSFLTCLGDSSSLRMRRSKVNIINEYNSRYFWLPWL